uniref:UDP-N-acetylglucosamine--dolichyl-phosphate N-acetylglucosaminephosphotransferase n=1 Tax=Schistosoma haematobium TaxID=6185 RepID=A0A095AEX1_SCHHA
MESTCASTNEGHLLSTYRHFFELLVLVCMSIFGAKYVLKLFKKYKGEFLRAGFAGVDMNKPSKPTLPEAQGVICGVVFLSIMFLFIPVPFWRYLVGKADAQSLEFIQFLAGLLSICCMLFLGFADDALNLPWRHKIGFPFVAGLPLLMVYLANEGTTSIAVPVMLRNALGSSVDIGILYYIYMGLLTVFCTNSINIYAGVNGLEVGQAIVIGASLILFNLIELSSMTFAVVGILGHFSKTLLLFFLPQIVNFLYSTPQLFGLIPCPRHRLPRYDPADGLLHPSRVRFHPKSLSRPGQFVLTVFSYVGIIECKLCPDCIPNISTSPTTGMIVSQSSHENMSSDEEQTSERQRARSRSPAQTKLPTEEIVEVDNLTVINMMLRVLGPRNEQQTTNTLLLLQILCSCFAFMIRYPLAWLFYDVPAK